MSKGRVSRAWQAGYAAGYAAARGWSVPAGDKEKERGPAPSSDRSGWEPLLADLEQGRIVLLPAALVRRYRTPHALTVSIARAARRRGFRVQARLGERGLAVRRTGEQAAEAGRRALDRPPWGTRRSLKTLVESP